MFLFWSASTWPELLLGFVYASWRDPFPFRHVFSKSQKETTRTPKQTGSDLCRTSDVSNLQRGVQGPGGTLSYILVISLLPANRLLQNLNTWRVEKHITGWCPSRTMTRPPWFISTYWTPRWHDYSCSWTRWLQVFLQIYCRMVSLMEHSSAPPGLYRHIGPHAGMTTSAVELHALSIFNLWNNSYISKIWF